LRLDLIRKEKHFEYDDHDLTQIEDESDSPEKHLDRMQHTAIVREAVSQLPPEQAEIVHLSFYEGLSHGDIAERLDLPLGTVKSRMRLAFKRVKDSIGGTL
jgi:RNA polymerase sigma-70 factor (ECF subfamily)